MGSLRVFAVALVVLAVLTPPTWIASAQDSLELYVAPKTDAARDVARLFNLTFVIAMVVFVLVEALLVYTLWRWRRQRSVKAGETHRGNAKAEIAWTVVPAAILLGLGSVSAVTLFELDTVPDDTDFTVTVYAERYLWRFEYPDGNSTVNDLRVQEGARVRLDVTATDVIHSMNVPSFAIKIDAIPGRTTHQWFDAPEPGEYFLQCTEYCGVGHHIMQAKVTVFPEGSQPLPYGRAPRANATGQP